MDPTKVVATQKDGGGSSADVSDHEMANWSGGCLAPIVHLLPPALLCCASPDSDGPNVKTRLQPERILRAADPGQRSASGSAQVKTPVSTSALTL